MDFIRTLRLRGTAAAEEELPDAAAVAAWVGEFGPWEPGTCAAAPGHDARARELREAIHELITAARSAAGAGSCSPRARETVNNAAALPVPAPRLEPSGRLSWHAAEPVLATLALVARDALDLVTSPAIGRVHECAGPGCHALFLDSSRPGTRRWCSMNTCGNKVKKEALRSRRRQD
ncbi:CGNR zinc finger domain-containing protein [Actinomadura kijaniata]|uniref:CGNR zinc finger domain-containing protein n=1 Tax=Actinomadura kijaniata TaxID=46161 RepID=UPI003F1BE8C4